MNLYTKSFTQTGNSCAASTLMIALYEKGVKSFVDRSLENELYQQTIEKTDPRLTKNQYSSPKNIIETAQKYGLKATLYKTQDIDVSELDEGQEKQLIDFVDSQKPQVVTPKELFVKLGDNSWLQLLTYRGNNQESKHWVLFRKYSGRYYVYDTAIGVNKEVTSSPDPDEMLFFKGWIKTHTYAKEDYSFLGVAIHLQ